MSTTPNEQSAERSALIWYRDEAAALAKHLPSGAHTQAVLASLTVLALDGGRRADTALSQPPSAPSPNAGVREALEELVKSFPTDSDLYAAGWEQLEVEAACLAYDKARAALSGKNAP